jgi:DNA-3-methyladenine glycosylase II
VVLKPRPLISRCVTEAAHHALRDDEYLAPLVDEHGPLRLDPAEDLYRRIVISILRQQVSMASAAAVRERLFDRVEVTPAGVLAADDDTLRDVGLSRQKTRYLNTVADAFQREGYSKEYFADRETAAIREALTDITGIGPWTANMQLLFTFARPDVFPVGDLGVRQGMESIFGTEMSRATMVERAERWRPYRSYATLYLWRVQEGDEMSVEEVRSAASDEAGARTESTADSPLDS